MLKAGFKRLSPDATWPEYKTKGAAGFDLASCEYVTIPPHTHTLVGTGLVVACPPGHYLQLSARSSLFKNFGLIMVNAPGILDEDYCGNEDEVMLSLYNIRDTPAVICAGDRLCQGVFQLYTRVQFEEVEDMGESRGGYGSTGLN